MEPAFRYKAEVMEVVDGDTLEVRVRLGFDAMVQVKVRLHGVNTPEVHGVKKGSEEHMKGLKAMAFVEAWVERMGHMVVLESTQTKGMAREKYGRWLAKVYGQTPEGVEFLNDELVKQGHAVRYMV